MSCGVVGSVVVVGLLGAGVVVSTFLGRAFLINRRCGRDGAFFRLRFCSGVVVNVVDIRCDKIGLCCGWTEIFRLEFFTLDNKPFSSTTYIHNECTNYR